MWLQTRMYLLVGLMFAILYALIAAISTLAGVKNFGFFAGLAVFIVFIQYMIGPKMVELSMRVNYVSEDEEPDLHRMIGELAENAGIPKPRVGISNIQIPNAFAFGRSKRDARVCVTRGILNILNRDELRAVLGHEISHVRHRDMAIMTILSVIPLICYYIALSTIFSRGGERGNAALIGIIAFIFYFITNLLVLYGSRIREYYADAGSVELGNQPQHLATALYKLAYGSAKVSKRSLKEVEGTKAFFVNDVSAAREDIKELRDIDLDMSGTIDRDELIYLREKEIKLSTSDKLMEILGTHPNMVKRIKHLSSLA
ncbi:MAG: heat shock protein HtpX [Candidatus Methanolliviera sp. GoM_oil]|nr:MAG: heat shock protein HtpX [Candidatus Methanolliviera sp. GoM_oil]